jgi:hypothetical protein
MQVVVDQVAAAILNADGGLELCKLLGYASIAGDG